YFNLLLRPLFFLLVIFFFSSFFHGPATTDIYTLPYTTLFRSSDFRGVDEAPPLGGVDDDAVEDVLADVLLDAADGADLTPPRGRSEEHTSELQSQSNLVCRLLLEKKNGQCLGGHAGDPIHGRR